jgi:hypothetical protein
MFQFLLHDQAMEWWIMQKFIKLSWNDFKIKLNDKFTLFNQILKDGQE